jgi:Mg-chelatase subunit ChlD
MRRLTAAFLILFVFSGVAGCSGESRDAGGDAGGGEERAAAGGGSRKSGGSSAADGRTSGPETSAGGVTAEEQAQASLEATTAEPVLDEQWYRDSDGNYVPDFVEVANGFDPKRNDCAPEQCPGSAQGSSLEFLAQERNALLILDSSGSMATVDGSSAGQTKMEAAKEALLRYAGPSSVVYETGFAVFGHTGDSTRAGKAESCREAAEVLSPLGRVDPDTFGATLERFEPTGWTPIEGALRESEKAFAGKEGQENRIILVSDGIETCGGDPVAAAERLHRSGIEVTIDVVGFGVPDDEAEQLRDIATAGGGEYHHARTGADLDEFFREQSEATSKTFDAFTCELRNGFHDTLCDQNQCNDATVFRIPEEQQKYEFGSPEYEALQDLSERITAGFERRQEARDRASTRADELYEEWTKLQAEYRRVLNQAYGV